jgi:hypothetical protein
MKQIKKESEKMTKLHTFHKFWFGLTAFGLNSLSFRNVFLATMLDCFDHHWT